MLSYVEEIKKLVDEMSVWDGRIRMAKQTIRRKGNTVSSQEYETLKNMVKGNVAFKIRSYLELCAFIERNNVFYGKEILNALPDYKGEGYALVAEKYKKEIINKYIRKNTPMTKNIAYLVDITKLFEKSTHKTWVTRMIKSPYKITDRQDISGYKVNSCWHLLIDENYLEFLQNQEISPERLEQLILDGKCVLMSELYTEDDSQVIDKKYVFDMAMDSVGKTIYEKMYPNLRINFWELYNERIIKNIKREIESKKDRIKEENANILDSKRKIENQNDDIAKLNEMLEK